MLPALGRTNTGPGVRDIWPQFCRRPPRLAEPPQQLPWPRPLREPSPQDAGPASSLSGEGAVDEEEPPPQVIDVEKADAAPR